MLTSIAWRTKENCAWEVQAENSRALGITGEPVDRVVSEDLRALPQYNVGHARRITEISEELSRFPNLYLDGNFFRSRSIADCVETAERVAGDLGRRFSA